MGADDGLRPGHQDRASGAHLDRASSALPDVARTVDAVWRIEGARVVGTLARLTGDVSLAEDLAQDAVADALAQWPSSGVPANPGAWLTTVARRKAIDAWRRRERLDERYRQIAHSLEEAGEEQWEPVADDILRLVLIACHPVLSRESQVALTLRVVSGLTTTEIARLLLVPVPTVQQRIVRGEEDPRRGARAVRDPRAAGVGRPAGRGSRRRLPALHRGVRRDGRRAVGPPRARG